MEKRSHRVTQYLLDSLWSFSINSYLARLCDWQALLLSVNAGLSEDASINKKLYADL